MVDEPAGGPSGELTIRTMAMPADANANGDIFGGWVLAQMDIAGGIAAGTRARGRVATVAIQGLSFLRPVAIGDILCVYTDIPRIGTTSLTVRLETWARRASRDLREKVTEGEFTYVAIDDDGRPRKVPDEGM